MTFLTHGMQSWDPLSLGSTMTRSVPIGCQLQKPRAPTAYGIWPLLKNPHTSPYWNASPSESSSEPLSVSIPTVIPRRIRVRFSRFSDDSRGFPLPGSWIFWWFGYVLVYLEILRDFHDLAKFQHFHEILKNLQSGCRFFRFFIKKYEFHEKFENPMKFQKH